MKSYSEKRHIAIFVPSLRGGGAERVMVTLANGFAKRGYRVDLVLSNAVGPYLNDVSKSVKVIDLSKRRVLFSLIPLIIYIYRNNPDVMLSALTHANIIAVIARFLSTKRVRIFVSERNNLSASSGNLSALKFLMLRFLMKTMYSFADGIIAVSEGVADDLSKTTGLRRNTISVIYNPVITPELLQRRDEIVNHPWFYKNGPQILLGVGRLVEQKRFNTLIDAFAIVRKIKNVRLLILGEGTLRDELSRQIKFLDLEADIELLGFVHNPLPYMTKSSVYVLSSAWEGLPNTLIQAMACEIPVVSTNCPSGPNEILVNGRWGRLVDVDHVEGLASAILETLDQENHPNVFERACDFEAESIIDSFISHLLGSKD